MSRSRYLIVNADDFGLSAGVNRGIIETCEHGIVTSASLMVRGTAAAEAAAYACAHPRLSVGLHVDLGEWIYRDDSWAATYEVVDLSQADAVREEIERQLTAFRALVGQDPAHLDSHQHVHCQEPQRSVMRRMARGLGVPLRHFSATVRHVGTFYGQSKEGLPLPDRISATTLLRLLTDLPPGITELACHPGFADDLTSPYRSEREQEIRTLCDPRVPAALADNDITLCSFRTDGLPGAYTITAA